MPRFPIDPQCWHDDIMPFPSVEPLDLQDVRAQFDGDDWGFELKFDGFRSLAHIEDRKCRLFSRTDHEYKRFADLRAALPGDIDAQNAILDGELVVLDNEGKPQFNQLLYNRAHPIFAAFDVVWVDGNDLRDRELAERKKILRAIIRPSAKQVLYVNHVVSKGKALFKQVCARDLEGIVAKALISRYQHGKGKSPWIKIRNPNYSQKEGRADLFNKQR